MNDRDSGKISEQRKRTYALMATNLSWTSEKKTAYITSNEVNNNQWERKNVIKYKNGILSRKIFKAVHIIFADLHRHKCLRSLYKSEYRLLLPLSTATIKNYHSEYTTGGRHNSCMKRIRSFLPELPSYTDRSLKEKWLGSCLKKIPSNLMEETIFKRTEPQWAQKWQFLLPIFSCARLKQVFWAKATPNH